MAEGSQKRDRRVLRKVETCVLALVLALFCIEGTLLWASYQRIAPVAEQVQQDSDAIDAAVEAGDMDTVLTSLASINTGIDSLQSELGRAEWNVAALFPVLGQDVSGARSLLAVGKDVMRGTVMPVHNAVSQTSALMRSTFDLTLLQALSSIMGGSAASASGVEQLVAMLNSVDGALSALEVSHVDIDADVQALDSLEGTLHFTKLIDARDRLAETLSYLADLLDQAQPVLDGYADAKQTAGEVADAAQQGIEQVGAAVSEAFSGTGATGSEAQGDAEASGAQGSEAQEGSQGSSAQGDDQSSTGAADSQISQGTSAGESSDGGFFDRVRSGAEKVGSDIAQFNQGVKDSVDEAASAVHETFSSIGEGLSGLFGH